MKPRDPLVLSLWALAMPLVFLFGPVAQSDGKGGQSPAPRPTTHEQQPDPIPEVSGMVYIPPGEFIMGSTMEDMDSQADLDEYPQRRVFVDGFYMDVNEVTNIQYKVFVDSTGRKAPSHWINRQYPKGRDGYPVVGVTWHDAVAYAQFMGKRLPTEAEWEKAARGTDGRRFPWGDEWDKKNANNGDRLMPIQQFPEGKSPFGLFDMAGNAAEWVHGWYQPYQLGESDPIPEDSPKFRNYKPSYGEKKYRVYRGGSWNSFAKYLRCANREKARPGERWQDVGFRCAMDPPWKVK